MSNDKPLRPMEDILKSWEERAKEKGKERETQKPDSEVSISHNVVKLPACKDTERTIPNIIARSALFGVIKRGARPYKNKELIASRGDVKIYYTGKTLDQADCTVWMQALAFVSALGQDVPVNRSLFLKSLGKTTGKKDYLWLDSTLHRLMTGVVSIVTDSSELEFHLIDTWGRFRDGDNPVEYLLNVNPKVIRMWANSEYTRIEWSKRLAIKCGSDLANWMQLYIRSNAYNGKPHHISLAKIKEWCGLSNMRSRQFRQNMLKALAELVRIGEIKSAGIREEDNMIFFTRITDRDSNTYNRHSNAGDRDIHAGDRDIHAGDRDIHAGDRDIHAGDDRDIHAGDDRDIHAGDDRDIHAQNRDIHAQNRDIHAQNRDIHAGHQNKLLIFKRFFGKFFP